MSRKGRNGRSKKNPSQAGKARPQSVASSPPSTPPPEAQSAPASSSPSRPPTRSITPLAFAATRDDDAKSAGAALASPAGAAASQDEGSTPPVELDHAFFDGRGHHADAPHDEVERDPRLALKMSAAAAQRRAQLTKYVKGAVALASALCLAALVKVAVARSADQAPAARPAVAAMTTTAPDPAQTPAPPAEATASAQPAPPPAEANAAADTAPAPSAPAAGETPSQPDPRAAAKAKDVARAALERGAVAKSIEAGEASVTLDATDGEAWLILGAAYQQKGDVKDARRCYKACLEQGKRGPKNECAEMLR